jgi:hypothetical protein
MLTRVGRYIEEDTQAVKDDYEGTAEEEEPGLYDIKMEGYEADVGDDLTNVSLALSSTAWFHSQAFVLSIFWRIQCLSLMSDTVRPMSEECPCSASIPAGNPDPPYIGRLPP